MTKSFSPAPNILLVMTDQFNPRFIGAYQPGFPKTPHLDHLAEKGVLFRNFYCNSPLCVPSRGSLLTGRFVTNAEVYDNGSDFSSSLPTFAHHLTLAGYRTILSGKMHFIGPDQLHGFEERLTTDIYPATFAWTADWSLGLNHGENQGGVGHAGVIPWSTQLSFDSEVQHRSLAAIRDIALNAHPKPFLLCVSYTHPHDPYVITEPYWKRYDGVAIPMPSAPPDNIENMHPYNQWIQLRHGLDTQPPTETQIQAARRAYAGMASYIDDLVGELIGELDRNDLLENTVVIFTSDHGDMMGEHGMWYKRTYMEDSIRIPMIVSWPANLSGGNRVDTPASLVDLYPTLLELAGVPDRQYVKTNLDGRSLLPLLTGEEDQPRLVRCEYCGEGVLHPALSLRLGKYKYIYVHSTPAQLFDMESDPFEQNNLSGHPDMKAVEDDLAALVPDEWKDGSLEQRILADQSNRLLIKAAMRKGSYPAWDYQPTFDASKQYRRE